MRILIWVSLHSVSLAGALFENDIEKRNIWYLVENNQSSLVTRSRLLPTPNRSPNRLQSRYLHANAPLVGAVGVSCLKLETHRYDAG